MRGAAQVLALTVNLLPSSCAPLLVLADASASWSTSAGFVAPPRKSCQRRNLETSSARTRKVRRVQHNRGHHLSLSGLDSLPDSTSVSTITTSGLPVHAYVPTALRATASALLTYIGIVAYLDRPRGTMDVGNSQVRVQPSTVPGAGLGLFAVGNLARGTVLGTYPGVVVPLIQHTRKLQEYPACEGYVWRFSDNQMVIDPTNQHGVLEETVIGGNPSQPGSVFLFESIFSKLNARIAAPTSLCRINEPPRGKDVNVVTREDLSTRTVTFELERDVYGGEELFIDYGLSYDRSRYGGDFVATDGLSS